MQLEEKPELNQINQKSEALVKTYQPDRPITEPKSVAKNYQPDLLPIKKRKSVAVTLLKITFLYFPLGIILSVIVAAIAIPDVASCGGNKAKHSEAKQYVASINKGQQFYYAENNTFSNSISPLGLGLKNQTTYYNYSAIATKNAAFSYGVARSDNLLSYVGAVFLVPVSQAAKNKMTTVSIICAVNSPGNTKPANPILLKAVPVCASGTELLMK
ncbi:type IV pilin-like G/H family protein [Microcoleus sp. CAWBG640]|uniref:type IV pilin-like G/H family protein n=1 Tax=Microcoleus sp. CAWBG640 TaxID=2841653 RepID=UPI00312B3669